MCSLKHDEFTIGEGVEADIDPEKEIENVMQTEDIFADLLR